MTIKLPMPSPSATMVKGGDKILRDKANPDEGFCFKFISTSTTTDKTKGMIYQPVFFYCHSSSRHWKGRKQVVETRTQGSIIANPNSVKQQCMFPFSLLGAWPTLGLCSCRCVWVE